MENVLLQPTFATWVLIIFGGVTLTPLILAQLIILTKPHSQLAKDILVAKGKSWRDKTHFRSALGFAWADWIVLVPITIIASVGVILGYAWGYVFWGAAGSISLYINIVLWFMEREYFYPSRGALRYYTYYWGFFVYWGALALVYSAIRLGGIDILGFGGLYPL